MKKEIQDKLEQYGQTHLLTYYEKLPSDKKKYLEKQLEDLDWSLFSCFEEGSKEAKRGKIEPIDALQIKDILPQKEAYRKKGLAAIKEGKIAAMLLAGGQGTRLGLDGPKGSCNIGVSKDLYIFEMLFRNTMDVVKEAGAYIPFYIMTSEKNHRETVDFLKEHSYFGYDPSYVFFFTQTMSPCLDSDKKLLMEAEDRLATSPNGNGGWFSSFVRSGLEKEARDRGVEWLNCFSVDNVLQKIADPGFIGAVLDGGYVSGSKVVRKADPEERVGVMCLENGRPSIIEYYEMSQEMRYQKNEAGDLAYNFGVILNYLFSIEELEKITKSAMRQHTVEKKIPYVDTEGCRHSPEKPNGYKFETLIIDMINLFANCLVYEVEREKEFAPIKNKEGVDSIDSARTLLEKNGVSL